MVSSRQYVHCSPDPAMIALSGCIILIMLQDASRSNHLASHNPTTTAGQVWALHKLGRCCGNQHILLNCKALGEASFLAAAT